MPNQFVKIATIGEAEGQEIVNIFYFVPDDELSDLPLSVIERVDLGAQWNVAFDTTMSPLLSADYVGREHQLTTVNLANETISDFAVSLPNTCQGSVAGGSDTVALAAIVGQQCVAYGTGPGIRVPKKSYLALGPLASANIGDEGLLLWNSAERQSVVNMCYGTRDTQTAVWSPVRVGVLNAAGVPAVGRVVSAIVRQYCRPRKSRLFRANGR